MGQIMRADYPAVLEMQYILGLCLLACIKLGVTNLKKNGRGADLSYLGQVPVRTPG